MPNNVNWGYIDGPPQLIVPGDVAGEGRCEPKEWGVGAEDVIIYANSLGQLREWLTAALENLPTERGENAPLVTVDLNRQRTWLEKDAPLHDYDLGEEEGDPWVADAVHAGILMDAIADNPAAAGWTLADDVIRLWAEIDENADDALLTGVEIDGPTVLTPGALVTAEDLHVRGPIEAAEHAAAALIVIAERINNAY